MELIDLFDSIYRYNKGLKKTCFNWCLLPDYIDMLAFTDTTGLFIYNNTRYYVSADSLNNITIERD